MCGGDGDGDGGGGEGTSGSGVGSEGDSGSGNMAGESGYGGGMGDTGDTGGAGEGDVSPIGGVVSMSTADAVGLLDAQNAMETATSRVEFDEAQSTAISLSPFSQPGLDANAQAQKDAALALAAQTPIDVDPFAAQLSVNPLSTQTLSQAALDAISMPINSHPFAQGQYSMAAGMASRAETGVGTVTAQDVAEVSEQDSSTYAAGQSVLNIAAPALDSPDFDAAITGSRTAASLNPGMNAAIHAIGSLMPGNIGLISTISQARSDEPGLIDVAADALGLETPSFLDPVVEMFDPVTTALDDISSIVETALDESFDFATDLATGALGGLMDVADSIIGPESPLGEGLAAIDASIGPGVSEGGDTSGDFGADGGAPDLPAPEIPEIPDAAEATTVAAAASVDSIDSFISANSGTNLISIPNIETETLGIDEDLGVAPMMSPVSTMGSFRRSRKTSIRDRAFGAANLFRPTLSAGIRF